VIAKVEIGDVEIEEQSSGNLILRYKDEFVVCGSGVAVATALAKLLLQESLVRRCPEVASGVVLARGANFKVVHSTGNSFDLSYKGDMVGVDMPISSLVQFFGDRLHKAETRVATLEDAILLLRPTSELEE